jgi:hypothetical protein
MPIGIEDFAMTNHANFGVSERAFTIFVIQARRPDNAVLSAGLSIIRLKLLSWYVVEVVAFPLAGEVC